MPYVALNYATGELVANITGTSLSSGGGGSGFADMYVQPVNLGWHLKHADVDVGYAFTAPTGRYTAGAGNNVGSGYWDNSNITSGTTFYITKNKATTANLATDWEVHGQRQTTSTPAGQFSEKTPGQAFTDEWGVGQVLPLKKDFSRSPITPFMELVFNPISSSQRRTWQPSSSTTTSIRPRLAPRDARSCSVFHGPYGFQNRTLQSRRPTTSWPLES